MEPRVLCKARKTKRQMELPFDLRVTNIQGSFKVAQPERIRGKRVLLIDDVFTTGSTLDEAAKMLLESGASVVYAYTLSKSLRGVISAPPSGQGGHENLHWREGCLPDVSLDAPGAKSFRSFSL